MFGCRTALFVVVAGACFGVCSAGAIEGSAPKTESVKVGADPSSRERAKRLYEEGLSAYRAGKFSDAIDKLLEADRVMPNAAFSYNIGLVYEARGNTRSALRWLRSYLRQSAAETDQTSTLGKVSKLEAQLEALGLQQVSVFSDPPGATLTIDGVALGLTPFTTELPPGSHSATLTLIGHQAARRDFELRSDRAMDVDVVLVADAPLTQAPATKDLTPKLSPAKPNRQPAVAVLPPPAAPALATESSPRVTPWTWISLGVGSALLGGALAFEVKRRHEQDAAAVSASQVDFQDHYARIEPAQTRARGFLIAGSAVLATGLGLLTFDLVRSGPTRTATIGSCVTSELCATLLGQF